VLAERSIAWADDAPHPQSSAIASPSSPFPSDLTNPVAGADDRRTSWEQKGVTFSFSYFGDLFDNPSGGVRQGAGYDGRFGMIVDVDLAELGWSGAKLHASFHQIHGDQFSAGHLDNLATVSGIEAPPSTRLFNLWIERRLGSQLNLRVGQFTAAQEFLVSQNAGLFVNATFGWPVLAAQDLPSGGPSYPEATPGVRLTFAPNPQLTIRAAIFNGDPAGPGAGNPVERDPYGLAFRVRDPPFLIAELAFAHGQPSPASPVESPSQEGMGRATGAGSGVSGLPGEITLGAWGHAGWFADQRFDARGGLLALSGGPPLQHRGDFGLYAMVDQMLWRAPGGGDRALNVFFRAVAAPSDRNLIDLYFDGGFTFNGPFASRADDTIGLAVSFSRISPRAVEYDRDLAALSGEPTPIRDFEAVIELTYQAKINSRCSVQPNIQYVVHPGGHIADPLEPSGLWPIRDAIVLGMRTIVRF
jgi:porin